MLQKRQYDKFRTPAVLNYLQSVPYDIGRDHLYTPRELYDAFDPARPETFSDCYDVKVYQHYRSKGPLCQDVNELWARHCHDSAILDALREKLQKYPPRQIVGIMGWHALLRDSSFYRKIVLLAKKLTEMGWLIITGGGPGAMEAAHLGSWLAGKEENTVDEALEILREAPSFRDYDWLGKAHEVSLRFPQTQEYESVSIPTWLYGHEPPALFATHCAKLFSNSIREDTLIEKSCGGLIFMPGSAGTLEELFLAAERNHYLAGGYPSPIIFVGKQHWTENVPFYPVVLEMLKSRRFENLLTALVDDIGSIEEIVSDFHNIYSMIRAKQEGKAPQDSSSGTDGSGEEI